MADPVIGEPGRVCSRCGLIKPANLEFFSPKRSGLNTRCKICVAEFGRLRWSDPDYHAKQIAKRSVKYADPSFQEKERLRQQGRQADPVHIAAEAERQKKRLADPSHQQRELERARRRRTDPEYRAKVSKFGKKWYAAKKVERAAKGKAWYDKNRDQLIAKRSQPEARERTNRWTRSHLRKNPHLKVNRSVGAAISEILKAGCVKGAFRWLPYSKADLRAHLERQFLGGMEWINYGTVWHVDHILPQASFKIDPDDPARCREFQACWALTNLRPLWKRDNLAKNARRTHLI